MVTAILAATLIWFVVASVLFFNPIVGKIYDKDEQKSGVRALPKNPKTVFILLAAILVQVAMWAMVYTAIKPVFPGFNFHKGVFFGLILIMIKMIPRDVDRMILSTYPDRRMLIEFIIGSISCLCVGITFGYLL
jgi:hypothetical protein